MTSKMFVCRAREIMGPAAVVALCLILTWEASMTVRAYRAGSRGLESATALAALHDLRAEIDRLGMGDPTAEAAADALHPASAPPLAPRKAEALVRNFFEGNPAALDALDRFERLHQDAKDAACAALLETGPHSTTAAPDLNGPREAPAPAIRAKLREATGQIEYLEERCTSSLTAAAAEAARSRLALLASLAIIGFLLFSSLRADRMRRRHERGARLVEDMLEAYSRRLEAMNIQLEQVNLLKTQFLANTSHELLTPLNGVLGSLEVIRSGACHSREQEHDCLEKAHQSAERLASLIRDLLDLCHLEEGNLALRCHPLDFGAIIERELGSRRSALEARGLILLVVPPPGGWPRVAGDPERITQVIHHILENAVKFTERGSLRVTGRIDGEAGRYFRFELADTGIGIEPAKIGQVFDLFSQADGSNTRRFGGAGLGLTLCRHLVLGMGGQIGIESEGPGFGTRVWFTLPLTTLDIRSGPPADSANDQSRAA